MASTYRFYRTPRLGDGLSTATGFRSKLNDLNIIKSVLGGTEDFWNWTDTAMPASLCFVWCDTAKHATIAADPEIFALSPELADIAAVNAWLDGLVGTLSPALVTRLESDGFPLGWMNGATTRRQMFRKVSQRHLIIQQLVKVSDNAFNFFKRNLDETVASVPVGIRNRASAWMVERGMDTTWITGPTLVREVVTFVLGQLNLPVGKLHQELDF